MPVFQGSTSEVLVLQSICEANGIATFTPDLNIPYLDTIMGGGGLYSARLMVPEDRLEDARSLVPESKRKGIPAVEPEAKAEAEAEEVARMARRVRICATLIVTAPLGIYFGWEYRKRTRDAAQLPASHSETMFAFWFCVAVSVVVPLYFLLRVPRPGP
jgi:hypothetical protein